MPMSKIFGQIRTRSSQSVLRVHLPNVSAFMIVPIRCRLRAARAMLGCHSRFAQSTRRDERDRKDCTHL